MIQYKLTTYVRSEEGVSLVCPFKTSSPSSLSHVQDTSKEAYYSLLVEGTLGEQLMKYLRILKVSQEGLTDKEASTLLAIPASTVSARRNDVSKLLGSHIVINLNGERRKNKNGRSGLVWRIRR